MGVTAQLPLHSSLHTVLESQFYSTGYDVLPPIKEVPILIWLTVTLQVFSILLNRSHLLCSVTKTTAYMKCLYLSDPYLTHTLQNMKGSGGLKTFNINKHDMKT